MKWKDKEIAKEGLITCLNWAKKWKETGIILPLDRFILEYTDGGRKCRFEIYPVNPQKLLFNKRATVKKYLFLYFKLAQSFRIKPSARTICIEAGFKPWSEGDWIL